MNITMAHGSGGETTSVLIHDIFEKYFSNPYLNRMEDATLLPRPEGRLAFSTDSFVITPMFFRGGDIGKLSICGTVNDLLVSGAVPKYLTCGFIMETGADTDDLDRIAQSMARYAAEAGVIIVAGDTKVIAGSGNIYINTAGIGVVPDGRTVSIYNCRPGDVVLVSGNLGNHHAAILSERMNIENTIVSDCGLLGEAVGILLDNGIAVRAMRDITRGGLATILNEIAGASGVSIELDEERIPVSAEVRALCGLMGLDPLYMANEGRFSAVVSESDAERALSLLHSVPSGREAAAVGRVAVGEKLILNTAIGGKRILGELRGEGLPRIC